tara:strand:- start:2655 stop:2879 length:225 start_codon:yes stop_codon:yes gene_type:complete
MDPKTTDLIVKTYGKGELYQLLKSNFGFNINYKTFIKTLVDSLDLPPEVEQRDFKNRRIIYPKEVQIFKDKFLS